MTIEPDFFMTGDPASPSDFDSTAKRIYSAVRKYSMTGRERVYALMAAIRYVSREGIEGDFVECGVWRGGSVMAMALTLKDMGEIREIRLFDTFAGMPAPSEADGEAAQTLFSRFRISDHGSGWLFSPLEEVRTNLATTGYPMEKFRFISGKVEDTLPRNNPKSIALLRLDTDLYVSTKHALQHLFPRVSTKGVVIFDDYERWQGAKKAVDEYIMENNLRLNLRRIDSQARIAIKTSD